MPKILSFSDKNLTRSAEVLCRGGVVAFPTETVYGLGGNAYDDESVLKIFEYKGRPESKPLSVCYPSFEKALDDVELDDRALLLAEKFLPGPLTIVLKRRSNSRISRFCAAGFETIGVRIPANPVALELLSRLPFPLAAPSANKSGEPSPTAAEQVYENMKDSEDLIILDGGSCSVGVESTIVDLTRDKILRVGAVSAEKIIDVL
jgi:L-threonylcarbamoyladenylate synthase